MGSGLVKPARDILGPSEETPPAWQGKHRDFQATCGASYTHRISRFVAQCVLQVARTHERTVDLVQGCTAFHE